MSINSQQAPYTAFPSAGGQNGSSYNGTTSRCIDAVFTTFVNSKQATSSFSFKRDDTTRSERIVFTWGSVNEIIGHTFHFIGSTIVYQALNEEGPVGQLILSAIFSILADTNDQWYQVVIAFDLADTAKRFAFVDDVLDTTNWAIYIDQNISMAPAVEHWCWAHLETLAAGESAFYKGDLSECRMDLSPTAYTAINVTANRRAFVLASGLPALIGGDGSRTTGIQPTIYAEFGDPSGTVGPGQTGTGPDFTGAVAITSADGPNP